MNEDFFERPILNSPYRYPSRHWELDESGQPTGAVVELRRPAKFVTPIPKPKKQRAATTQELVFDEGLGISSAAQQYDVTSSVSRVRRRVDEWRSLPDPAHWRVTPETARLLQHWRSGAGSPPPFFCQVEAVETAIWLTEVAPQDREGKEILELLGNASRSYNPDLLRIALKLATGAGKTTVMAMLIAWQTVNAVRHPNSTRFTRGFLIVTPGLTIRDRLRVLLPNDPESYYAGRGIVPGDLLGDIAKARIVITNYHAFKLREKMELSKGSRQLLEGRLGERVETLETEGQMLQRVMPELMGTKNVLVINDEAHHCYREKPGASELARDLSGEERKEAEQNNAAARLWISGLEAANRKLGVARVYDLSATPFFLRGSGEPEGTLFPWTVSDFSLMDAIECGIVKLPRVPVAQNIPGGEMPMFRDLWENIRREMPKKGRGKAGDLDPLALPTRLQTALQALYGHYEETSRLWEEAGMDAPPCFIIVCNNTSTSKLVYDYVSGFFSQQTGEYVPGRLELFRNYDLHGQPVDRPRTLLIDSEQLESGEGLDDNFRKMAEDEIERFRRERIQGRAAEDITDQELLREVMNTVGKPGRLGHSIRCVVSVSMLTEGWDANTVTHILGVRAFGTQLLCEQVIGRALRRKVYETNEEGLFGVEYADVLGIPFDFTAKPVVAKPQVPRQTVHVRAVRPDRDHLEIRFPRVEGYRFEVPEDRIKARFTDDSRLVLTPELVGPTVTQQSGIVGQSVDLKLSHLDSARPSTILYHLAQRLVEKYRDPNDDPKQHLFNDLKKIARQWLESHFECRGGTKPAQLVVYQELKDMACERILAAIRPDDGEEERRVRAMLDPYNPTGSSVHVNFNAAAPLRWQTDPRKCHLNWAVLDSDWEAELCRVVEAHPRVWAYVKNHNLGLEIPYRRGSTPRRYIPDYVLLVDDGRGRSDPLHLIVEVKGYRFEDAKDKKLFTENYWLPGVNRLGEYGRWAFAELRAFYDMEADLNQAIEAHLDTVIAGVLAGSGAGASTDQGQ